MTGWAGDVNDVGEGAARGFVSYQTACSGNRGSCLFTGALLEALSAGPGRKLTLLSGPAGWANTGDQAREALINARFSVDPFREKR